MKVQQVHESKRKEEKKKLAARDGMVLKMVETECWKGINLCYRCWWWWSESRRNAMVMEVDDEFCGFLCGGRRSTVRENAEEGVRWSTIAARLPGRTDNEIKNVWHTHLKKRLPQNQHEHNNSTKRNKKQTKLDFHVDASNSDQDTKQEQNHEDDRQQCSSDVSSHNNSSIATSNNDISYNNINNNNNNDVVDSAENNFALDDDFWCEVLSSDNSSIETNGVMDIGVHNYQFQAPLGTEEGVFDSSSLSLCQDMDFWHDVYARAEEITELLEL